jgi:Holliday junction resolvasome RuvABC ATP-dependent DNA helicase subunit
MSLEGCELLTLSDLALAVRPNVWALALKEDLDLWRQGNLVWADMSTRLLLAGPPGTGKTTSAKALCNTLQVPLVATFAPPGESQAVKSSLPTRNP